MYPDFESLLIDSPVAFAWHKMLYDENGKPCDYEFLLVNDAFQAETGLSKADIQGKRHSQLFPLEKLTFDWVSFYAEVAEQQLSKSTEQYVEQLKKWFSVKAFTNQKGFFAAIFTDITEKVTGEHTFRQAQDQLAQRQIIDKVYEVHTDLEGRFVFMNESYQRDFHSPSPNNTSKRSFSSLHPEDQNAVTQTMAKLLSDPYKPVSVTLKMPFRGGKAVNTKWSFRIWKNEAGIPEKIICLAHENAALHQLRKKMQDQELGMRQVFDDLLAGYWDWNLKENSEYMSPGFKRMFGYEDHEIANMPESWQKLIFEEDLVRVMESFRKHVDTKGEKPFYNEVRYRHKNGSTVWVICVGRVIEWDKDNKPIRAVGCHVDLSKQKSLEASLKATKQQLSSVLNTQREMICRYNAETVLTYVNSAYCRAFGVSEKELLGKPFITFIPEQEHAGVLQHIRSLSRKEPVKTQIHQTQLPNGEIVYQEWTDIALFDDEGNISEYQSTGIDITQRMHALMKVQESDAKFQDIAENIPLLIWLRNEKNNKMLYANKAYETIWGRSLQSLYDQPDAYQDAIHPDDLPLFYEALSVSAENKHFSCDYRIIRPDGEIRWVSAKQYPVYDQHGELIRYTGMAVDITRLKESEQKILRQNETLRQIAWEQSHLVRQPIAKVLGIANLLKTEQNLAPAEYSRFFDYLIESTCELDDMIKDIVKKSNAVEFELKKQQEP